MIGRFIQKSVAAKKPFFLYSPLSHMHVPHDYAQRFKNSSFIPNIYGDTLREMDLSCQSNVSTLTGIGCFKSDIIHFYQ